MLGFLFFIKILRIRILLFVFKKEPARQNKPARFYFTSCNSETISADFTTDCRVGFKVMQNSEPNYKRASSAHVISP